jgi:hypothetical protein
MLGSIGVIDQSPRLITDADWQLGIYGDWSEARDQDFVAAMRADFVNTVIEFVLICQLVRAGTIPRW